MDIGTTTVRRELGANMPAPHRRRAIANTAFSSVRDGKLRALTPIIKLPRARRQLSARSAPWTYVHVRRKYKHGDNPFVEIRKGFGGGRDRRPGTGGPSSVSDPGLSAEFVSDDVHC